MGVLLVYFLQFEKDQAFASLIYSFPKAEKCVFSHAYNLQLDFQNLGSSSTQHKCYGIPLR